MTEVKFSLSGQALEMPDEVAALCKAFNTAMMDSNELLYLAAVLSAYPWPEGSILVEIGAYHGETTVFMAKVLEHAGRRSHILSIDPFERATPDSLNPQGSYSAYLSNVLDHGYGDQCLPLVAFSQNAAGVVPPLVGVLVVDGSHHYEVVNSDLRLYAPKVLPGGYLFIDDYGPAYPDVVQACDEYFVPTAPFELLHKDYFVIARRRN